jgi:hypothetical protein
VGVLATFRVEGDTDRMIAAYDRAAGEIERAVADGDLGEGNAQPQAHYVCRTDEGMMVVEVWSSEDEARAFLDSPIWREALDREGIPQPDVRVYPLHRGIAARGAAARARPAPTRGSAT